MTNLTRKAVVGQKVKVINEQGPFKLGAILTVASTDASCGYGHGITTVEHRDLYCLAEQNYEVVSLVRPQELNLKEFLQALKDDETVVSVDDADNIDDTYASLQDLADDLCFYEVQENKFYKADDFDAYLEAKRELETPAEPERESVPFAKALLALIDDGEAISVYDEDGDHCDTYYDLEDLQGLTRFEIEDGVWYIED